MLVMKNIDKNYRNYNNEIKVIDNFSYEFLSGNFYMITGASGSGKTTLLNIIGLLETFDSGSYEINKIKVNDINSDSKADLRGSFFGYIFQNFNLIEEETVFENIALTRRICGDTRNSINSVVNNLLLEFNLNEKKDTKVKYLSGGEKQRTAIARAISNNPRVILADEPTGNLDGNNTDIVMKVLRDLNKNGITVIMVTHDLSLIQNSDIVYKL